LNPGGPNPQSHEKKLYTYFFPLRICAAPGGFVHYYKTLTEHLAHRAGQSARSGVILIATRFQVACDYFHPFLHAPGHGVPVPRLHSVSLKRGLLFALSACAGFHFDVQPVKITPSNAKK
jgi:hypothetical protein